MKSQGWQSSFLSPGAPSPPSPSPLGRHKHVLQEFPSLEALLLSCGLLVSGDFDLKNLRIKLIIKGNPSARSSAQSSHLCCEALRSWVKKTEKKSLWGQSHQHQFHSHKVLYQHCTYLNIKPSQKITGLNNHPGNFPPLKVCPGPRLNPQAHPSLVPGLQSPAQHRGSESEHCHQQGKEENCWGPRRDSESTQCWLLPFS